MTHMHELRKPTGNNALSRCLIVTGLASSALMSTASLANPVQWTMAEGGNGHWYELINNDPHLCWLEAEAYAEAIGGQLASLETLAEFEFTRALVYAGNGPYDTMIGLKQDEDGAEPAGGWRWASGEPLAYNQWASTLDDAAGCQDWAAFADGSGYGKLDDIYPCEGCVHTSYQRRMLVEYSADCNGDGIVDYGQILDGSLQDSNNDGVPDVCDNSPGSGAIQWSTFSGGNGHWYEFIPVDQSWDAHHAIAMDHGAHMVTITSPSEGQFVEYVRDAANSQGAFHTGGYQDYSASDYSEPGGGWRWITGEPFQYTNWGYSDGDYQPNNEGGSQNRIGIRWQENEIWMDVNQTTLWYGMIEWSADCNGDGIVDYGQILDGTYEDADGNGVPDCCDNDVPCDGSFFTVDDDGPADFQTIQAAVNAAASDAVIVVYPGTYTGSSEQVVRMMGKNIHLRSAAGPESTIIDGQGSRRCIVISDGESSTIIDGFTITNGYDGNSGGGIHSSSSGTLSLENMIFSNNHSGWEGGGLKIAQATSAMIDSCMFTGNTAFAGGGMAISSSNGSMVSNCQFEENSVVDDGAGLLAQQSSDVQIMESTFTGNSAGDDGGALWFATCSKAVVQNCVMRDNMASSRGGGMHVQSSPSVTARDCTFEGNHGHNGGGAFVDSSSSLLVTSCHFEANQGDGGAIQAQQGSLFLEDSMFLANSGYDGGAIYCWSTQIDVDNCLFQANVAEDDAGAMLLGGSTQATITASRFCENDAPNGQHVLGSFQDGGDNTFADICDCPSDVNDDGEIDVTDVLIVIAEYGNNTTNGDVNDDGMVDVNDLLQVLAQFSLNCG